MAHELNWTTFMGHESNETPHYGNIPRKFNDGAMKNV